MGTTSVNRPVKLPLLALMVALGGTITLPLAGLAQTAASSKPPLPDDRYVLGPDSLPPAGVPAGTRVTGNPRDRGIAGRSSGGVCAFTVAWYRPDQFRKVFSANGSFVNIRGGGAYPDAMRWLWRDDRGQ